MDDRLREESEKLARSWMRQDPAVLQEYLVSGVEDPRVNLQSVLSRHFLVSMLSGERFGGLMAQEYRFSAVMNWLRRFAEEKRSPEEYELVLHGLRAGSDNVEGIEIPQCVLETFSTLPANAAGIVVPNYIEGFLSEAGAMSGDQVAGSETSLNTFAVAWSRALAPLVNSGEIPRMTVLEPACGSANDYRFLHAYVIAPLIEYTGFDLSEVNVQNARRLFPGVRFDRGNVFEIGAPDKSYEVCFVHDLFEHLSIQGLAAAVKEVCRVTRRGICAGFFNMDEIREHVIRPVEEYYWNTLSMARTRELFAGQGFEGTVLHVATFLRQQVGCEETHNPKAYTFLSLRVGG